DIGTPERYLQASWDILERRVDTEIARRLDGDGKMVADGVRIDASARVGAPALIERGAELDPGAAVGPRAVIGRGTLIGADASVRNSVVPHGCRIGAGAT